MYTDWAEEYRQNAAVLNARIKLLKEQEKTVSVSELPQLQYRISTLYRMYLECAEIANLLALRGRREKLET